MRAATTSAANPSWMNKPILLKTTSIDLGDTTLLCNFLLNTTKHKST
jgi:hypothetical protein